ncbi:D-threitol dehydrogenase [Nesterenkonia cremea]|uniref:D-threitol dehydrogenase n=2 Tax=Nesterenkonia cremea TaxID=1882340 RepID=A0A917EL03_9MICC|nr:D-threitol dehydrogenase [Nesterenkonia cremea]
MNGGAGMFDLSGRVAMITGGASGLGEAIAHGLAQQGAAVVLADRDADRLQKVSADLQQAGAQVSTVELDVTDRGGVDRAVTGVAEDQGCLDILVNSAGVVALDPVEQLPDEAWDRTLEINLSGTFAVCRAAGAQMKAQQHGRIINIASQAAHVALEHHAAYSASKSGLFGLTTSLARELGPYGVTANTISPTVVMTELGKKAWADPHGDAHKAEIPARRFAEPEEIAATAVFLASKEAAMVNGADLRVDGGFTIV